VTGAAVEIDRACRTFRRRREVFTALRETSFTRNEGEVVGLLDVNRGGKTVNSQLAAVGGPQ
jgi:ABC-type polysaccharide/polyol phosphate transport system ATPase subunit